METRVFLSSSRLNVITLLFHFSPWSWTVLIVMCSTITPQIPLSLPYLSSLQMDHARTSWGFTVFSEFTSYSAEYQMCPSGFFLLKIYLFTCYYFIYLLTCSYYLFILSQEVSFLPRSYLMCRGILPTLMCVPRVCRGILSTLMCVYHVCAVPAKVRSSIRSSRN